MEVSLPADSLIVTLTHDGNANFAVWSVGADIERIDLLVNTIGTYEGTRPIQFFQEDKVSFFEITADGAWTMLIQGLDAVDIISCSSSGATRSGDDVVLVAEFATDGGAADLSYPGDSNFAIWAWGANDRDLLVNEIGPYEGTVLVPGGLFVWDVTAHPGEWSVGC